MNWQDELKEALATGEFERAKRAVDAGADVNARDEDGTTPLFWAAASSPDDSSAPARVKWALGAGARVGEENPKDGYTSVHAAAEAGNTSVLRLLLDADGRCAFERFDFIGRTPLICAVEKRHIEVARLLIDAGSDVNARDERTISNTALSYAISNGDESLVRLLLSAGANPLIRGWMQLNAIDRARSWRNHPRGTLRTLYEQLEQAARKFEV